MEGIPARLSKVLYSKHPAARPTYVYLRDLLLLMSTTTTVVTYRLLCFPNRNGWLVSGKILAWARPLLFACVVDIGRYLPYLPYLHLGT